MPTKTTIQDLPNEILHQILLASLPSPPPLSPFASDVQKLDAHFQFVQVHEALSLVSKRWYQTLGRNERYEAIGMPALERLLACLESGRVDGLSVKDLRIESHTEQDYEDGRVPFGEEDEDEGLIKLRELMVEILKRCPDVKVLKVYVHPFGYSPELSSSIGRLAKLKSIESPDTHDYDLIKSLIGSRQELNSFTCRVFNLSGVQLPSLPISTSFTHLSIFTLNLPIDIPILRHLLASSHRSLKSLEFQDSPCKPHESFDELNQALLPVRHQLETFTCRRTFHSSHG